MLEVRPLDFLDNFGQKLVTLECAQLNFIGRLGCSVGQVVNVLAFHSDDPSSNHTEAYCFFCRNLCLNRRKINKKEAGDGPFLFHRKIGPRK